jgi:hypothetical protein
MNELDTKIQPSQEDRAQDGEGFSLIIELDAVDLARIGGGLKIKLVDL